MLSFSILILILKYFFIDSNQFFENINKEKIIYLSYSSIVYKSKSCPRNRIIKIYLSSFSQVKNIRETFYKLGLLILQYQWIKFFLFEYLRYLILSCFNFVYLRYVRLKFFRTIKRSCFNSFCFVYWFSIERYYIYNNLQSYTNLNHVLELELSRFIYHQSVR